MRLADPATILLLGPAAMPVVGGALLCLQALAVRAGRRARPEPRCPPPR
jgi:hypothetical protein